jgi:hypothetical protein
MPLRTRILAVIVLGFFVLLFAIVGFQANSPDTVMSLVIAVVVLVVFIGLISALERNQRRTGGLFNGPMTPLKRILAVVLALFFGGLTVVEITSAQSIHFLLPIAAIMCLIAALRPLPSSGPTATAASLTTIAPQLDAIPRLDQSAWSNTPETFAPKRNWLPLALIVVGLAGIAVVVGLAAITNQRQIAAGVMSSPTSSAGTESPIGQSATAKPTAAVTPSAEAAGYLDRGNAHSRIAIIRAPWPTIPKRLNSIQIMRVLISIVAEYTRVWARTIKP